MPNWCCSVVSIGLPDPDPEDPLYLRNRQMRWEIFRDLRNLLGDEYRGGGGDFEIFNIFRPVPSELSEDEAYEWRCDKWGTKWEPNIYHYQFETPSDFNMCISTAWDTPRDLFKYMERLGFEFHVMHASLENSCWGQISNEEGLSYLEEDHEVHSMDEEDFERYHEELSEIEDNDEKLERLMMLGLETDDDFVRDEFRSMYEDILEEYLEWARNKNSEIDYRSENLKMKNKIMEWLEDDIKNNNMPENTYLQICNGLKNSGYHETKDGFHTMLDAKFCMSRFYYAWSQEPNLVSIYC